MNEFVFIKWGGSLITDKSSPLSAKRETIHLLSTEFAQLIRQNPEKSFILGHGSGSFGHYVASQYQTREGVRSPEQWYGFLEVWKAVRLLNSLVIQELQHLNIPCMAFPPSVTFLAENGKPAKFFNEAMDLALKSGIIPVVFGDVVFDTIRLFSYGSPLQARENFISRN
jgi:isopentenyl phosphate kinase